MSDKVDKIDKTLDGLEETVTILQSYSYLIPYIIFGIIVFFFIIVVVQGRPIKIWKLEIGERKKNISITENLMNNIFATLPSRKDSQNYIEENIKYAKDSVDMVFVTGGFISPVEFESMLKKYYKITFNVFLVSKDSDNRKNRL